MKILIVCVNYNSYGELRQFLDSVERSAENATDVHVEVIIADNSTMYEEVDVTSYKTITVSQQKFDNLGYLGGAAAIINNLDDVLQYDYVIISNVDILFCKDTLFELERVSVPENIAWIAQSTYSERYNKDLNPSVLRRYPPLKLWLLKFIYNNKYFYKYYVKFFFSNKKSRNIANKMKIYAGYGSCMILTKFFFMKYHTINYPIFLYGEELYFAELINKVQLIVEYNPKIKILDIGKASTSQLPSQAFLRHNREAIKYILREFY